VGVLKKVPRRDDRYVPQSAKKVETEHGHENTNYKMQSGAGLIEMAEDRKLSAGDGSGLCIENSQRQPSSQRRLAASGKEATLQQGHWRWTRWTMSGLPAIIRPAFTMAAPARWRGPKPPTITMSTALGYGRVRNGAKSLIDEKPALAGKEFRNWVGGAANTADNCDHRCSIENIDPMGVHTGDSITGGPWPDRCPTIEIPDHAHALDRRAARDRRRTGGSNVLMGREPR